MVKRCQRSRTTKQHHNTQLCQNIGTDFGSYGSHESLKLFNPSNANNDDDANGNPSPLDLEPELSTRVCAGGSDTNADAPLLAVLYKSG